MNSKRLRFALETLMIVAGIAAIRIQRLEEFVGVLVILCTAGAIVTYFYIRLICKKLFPPSDSDRIISPFVIVCYHDI